MAASPDRSALWRSVEIEEANPKRAPSLFVPARSLTEARALALDARKDGSARVTLIQRFRFGDGMWRTVETTFARGADRRDYEKALRAAGRVG